MKKFASIFLLSTILCGCSASANQDVAYEKLEQRLISAQTYSTTTQLAENVEPAIVGITANSSLGTSVGSGVCVASNGYIITNAHVLADSDDILVHLSTGESGTARLIWQDTVQDLAIIKTSKSLPYLPMSTSDVLKVGEDVVAVGTPLSLMLKHSFTKGIVSALNRTLKIDTANGESYMQNLIQHDASLNPGNSGGPLLNSKGEVVGINTLKISGGEGIGFAIPSKSFTSLVANVISSNGEYSTPYLGAYGFDGEIAKFNNLSSIDSGFYVVDVAQASPLKQCGVTAGCVIIKLNGASINNGADLRNALYSCKYGDKVDIEYFDGKNYRKTALNLAKNNLR